MGLKKLAVAGVTCLAMLAGCSETGAQSLGELASQVQTIRAAASAGDFETVLQRLETLRSGAWEMFRRDELSQADLQGILAAADRVESLLPRSAPPPPPPADADEPPPADDARQAEEEAKKQEEARKKAEEEARKQKEEAEKQQQEAAKQEEKPGERNGQGPAEGGEEGDDGEDDD